MRLTRNLRTTLAGFGLLAMASGAQAQQAPAPAPPPRVQPQPAQAQPAAGAAASDNQGLPGPIDSPQDLMDTAKIVFKLADTNNDNAISQKEAVDAGNLLVGGFFFRADQDGNGTVTKEEAKAARDALLAQQPWLRFVVDRANRSSAQPGQPAKPAQDGQVDLTNPDQVVAQIGSMLDINNDRQLQATELRQTVQSVVQSLFAIGDANRDGQLVPAELNDMALKVAEQTINASFQISDKDGNGTLSKQELLASLEEPAGTVFDILDRNLDGQLSTEELKQAAKVIANQIRNLRVPTPANSPVNLLGARAGG